MTLGSYLATLVGMAKYDPRQMKIWLVTYIRNGVDFPIGSCVLHRADCRYLRPTRARPFTGKRVATPAELQTQDKCVVC